MPISHSRISKSSYLEVGRDPVHQDCVCGLTSDLNIMSHQICDNTKLLTGNASIVVIDGNFYMTSTSNLRQTIVILLCLSSISG